MATVAAATAGLSGLAFVAVRDPARGGFPTCPVHAATGWWCAGCGSTRALHQLLNGHLVSALHYNPLTVVILPFMAWGALAWVSAAFGVGIPPPRIGRRGGLALAVVMTAFAVVRNLPGAPFTGLAPHA